MMQSTVWEIFWQPSTAGLIAQSSACSGCCLKLQLAPCICRIMETLCWLESDACLCPQTAQLMWLVSTYCAGQCISCWWCPPACNRCRKHGCRSSMVQHCAESAHLPLCPQHLPIDSSGLLLSTGHSTISTVSSSMFLCKLLVRLQWHAILQKVAAQQ